MTTTNIDGLTASVRAAGIHTYRADVLDVGATRATVRFTYRNGRSVTCRLPYEGSKGTAKRYITRLRHHRSHVYVDFQPGMAILQGATGTHSVRLHRNDGPRLAIHLQGFIANQKPGSVFHPSERAQAPR